MGIKENKFMKDLDEKLKLHWENTEEKRKKTHTRRMYEKYFNLVKKD